MQRINWMTRVCAGIFLWATAAIALPAQTITTLHSFNGVGGANPFSGLVQATDGHLYGTTAIGGANNDGTVFAISPAGMLTTLHSFDGTDGDEPISTLVRGTDGNFYGTTLGGGANGEGTAFSITPDGMLTTLHNFCSQTGCADGIYPYALVQDTDGMFYGVTQQGGTGYCGGHSCGTVFSLSVGLGPFVKTQPVSGKAGGHVKILGTDLTGATDVTFNGTAAAFTVISASAITTTVPTGATTGKVQVVTPGGTLSSNVPFRVLP